MKVHLGNEWISTSGTPVTINAWFVDNWVNYTTTGSSTQQVYNGSKPKTVYLDGVPKPAGSGWTYSSGIITITGAVASVALSWLTIATVWDDLFNGIIFGTGHMVGLIIFAVLIIWLTLAWKYTAVFTIPFNIILSLEYLANDLGWDALLMLLLMTFIIFQTVVRKGKT